MKIKSNVFSDALIEIEDQLPTLRNQASILNTMLTDPDFTGADVMNHLRGLGMEFSTLALVALRPCVISIEATFGKEATEEYLKDFGTAVLSAAGASQEQTLARLSPESRAKVETILKALNEGMKKGNAS